jgi:hypothetical protein
MRLRPAAHVYIGAEVGRTPTRVYIRATGLSRVKTDRLDLGSIELID